MDKRFKCTDCNNLFINRPERIVHWNTTECTFGNGIIMKGERAQTKSYVCADCKKAFKSRPGRQAHWRDTDCTWGSGTIAKGNKSNKVDFLGEFKELPNDTKFEVLDDIFGDLSDGAYFAIMEEHGVTF